VKFKFKKIDIFALGGCKNQIKSIDVTKRMEFTLIFFIFLSVVSFLFTEKFPLRIRELTNFAK